METICNDHSQKWRITGAPPYFAKIRLQLKSRDIIIIVFNTKFQNDLTIEMDVEFELWVHNELPMDILNYNSPFVLNDKEFFPRYPCFTELCASV